MSTNRFRRLDRRTTERLLDGAPGSAAPGGLGDVLNAAAAPARPGELAGEQSAVAEFRAARLTTIPQQRRRSMLKTTIAGLLTAKVLVPATAAAAVGGVALAGATGTLPGTGDAPDEVPGGKPAAVTTTPRAGDDTHAGTQGTPTPELTGLCVAYDNGEMDADTGKALDSPAFEVLVTEAGGKDKVAAYCSDLLADRPGKAGDAPSADRGTPPHPTGKPLDPAGDAPSADRTTPPHPTGKPSDPSDPADPPAERPTDRSGAPDGAAPEDPAGAPMDTPTP